MSSRAGRRTSALAAVAMALSVALAGCGGDGEPKAEKPSAASSATPTVSPSPTKTTPPLSKFEDRPQVKALRKFLDRVAKAVNQRDAKLVSVRETMTVRGQRVIPGLIAEDIGLRYLGPIPFTPTRVSAEGGAATIVGCLWGEGFAVDRKTKRPVATRQILPTNIAMIRDRGRWKVEGLPAGTHTCDGVKVRGVKW